MMLNRRLAAVAIPAAVVAVVGGVTSYTHIYALAIRTDQGGTAAHLLPLSLDGLIVAGSVVLLAGSRMGWLAVVPGVVVTLYANIAAMWPHGDLSAAVASWPAASFIIATATLERWVRSGLVKDTRAAGPAPVPVPDPLPVQPVPALNGSGWSRSRESSWS